MKFIKSAQYFDQFIIDGKPEVCFIGRSNVGKSSLINALSNNKISRVSNTPGRTQLINFFDFNVFRIVDLPGYGYAKVSKEKKVDLTYIIDEYLTKSQNLKSVFQICDANVITEMDSKMSKYFENHFDNHFIVLNKIDKINISTINNKITEIANFLNINKDKIIMVSASKKINVDKLNSLIYNSIKKIG